MKSLYRIALAATFVFSFVSCDDFLDSEPQSAVDPLFLITGILNWKLIYC